MICKDRKTFLTAGLALAGLAMLAALSAAPAAAQSIVVMVNDEPVTSYDIAQRQRFLALSSNLNDRMKARMQSEDTKQAFQNYMRENQPQSREEAQALQKKFVAKMQQTVIANAGQSMRKKAIDELVEERLMVQAATEQKITISDNEVNEFLTRMAKSGSSDRTLEQFLSSIKAQGVNPQTLKDRIRAQAAWRELIRRVYGSRVRASAPTTIPTKANSGTFLDVEIVRMAVGGDGSEEAAAEKMAEAEAIRKKFQSCAKLKDQVSSVSGAKIQSVKKANINDFRSDVQAVLQEAKAGEVAPPILKGKTIELHAICKKDVIDPPKNSATTASSSGDSTQEQFQLYSERHLKDIKARAHLKYPKNG